MVPASVLASSFAEVSRAAAPPVFTVGDPFPAQYDAARVAREDEQSRSWYGLRRSVITPSYRRKYKAGGVGVFPGAGVSPGL